MLDAAAAGELGALLVVGANPVSRARLNPAALKNTFLIVQDLFLTETAALADVVLPGRQPLREIRHRHQYLRRRADGAQGRRPRRSEARLRNSRPPRRSHGRTDSKASFRLAEQAPQPISASRAARNRAKPIATPSGSRPMASSPSSAPSIRSPLSTKSSVSSPATPLTASTSSQATMCTPNRRSPGLVPVTALAGEDLIVPAHDTLFTSGTLGRYSAALKQLEEHQAKELAKSAAD